MGILGRGGRGHLTVEASTVDSVAEGLRTEAEELCCAFSPVGSFSPRRDPCSWERSELLAFSIATRPVTVTRRNTEVSPLASVTLVKVSW